MVLDNMDPRSTIRGVFLLILAIMGNFTAETLGCRTRDLLENNQRVKHLVGIFILFFSVGIFSSPGIDPIETFKTTLTIYIMFILFTRMSLNFTIVVFILLAINYSIWNYIDYFKYKEDDKYYKTIDRLNEIQKTIYSIIIVTILIGFTLYFKKQYKTYKKDWSTSKFIFGVKKCKGN